MLTALFTLLFTQKHCLLHHIPSCICAVWPNDVYVLLCAMTVPAKPMANTIFIQLVLCLVLNPKLLGLKFPQLVESDEAVHPPH